MTNTRKKNRKPKNRKPRTATNRRVNQLLKEFGDYCEWWDEGYPECFLPWASDKEGGCHGKPFVCKKLFLKHLASAKKPDQIALSEFEQRERDSLVPIKHLEFIFNK